MTNLKPSNLKKIIQTCSRLLAWTGAAVFFIGDKFLREIKHMSFVTSETVGILGGILLMLIGLGIGEWAGLRVLPRKRK